VIDKTNDSSTNTLIMNFIKEFWEFMKSRKKYWLFPIMIVLAVFGVLIVLSQGSAIAPFIYTIF